jgi:hypothetical protein
MPPNSIASEAPLVASPNQAMRAIQVSRKKLYELINTGELESYTEGKSRRITVKSTTNTSSGDWPRKLPAALHPIETGTQVRERDARFAAANRSIATPAIVRRMFTETHVSATERRAGAGGHSS